MRPERWTQVKELLASALEHEVEERGAFLERACDADDGLRREVESLLASFKESDRAQETTLRRRFRAGRVISQTILHQRIHQSGPAASARVYLGLRFQAIGLDGLKALENKIC